MKIIQISAVYNIGSVGKIVHDIHSYLLTQNEDSYVLYGVGKDVDDADRIIKSTSKFERLLSHLYYLLTGINFRCCYFGTKKIIKTIKCINPDIIHIHCYNDYYVNIHQLFRWLSKHNKKVMLTQHAEHYYTGSCGYSLGCNKWKDGGCDSHCHFFNHRKKGYPLFDRTKLMWKRMYKSISSFNKDNLVVVSCTPWLDKRLKESIIMKDIKHHHVILNGADESIYKYYGENDKTIILYVTPRFNDEIKGSKNINKIARLFLCDKSIEFHIAGNVPDDYVLEDNVIKLGPLYGKELAKEYSKATVNIMLSKAECFPMVLVESSLCGTKNVAFECGGPVNAFDNRFARFVEWGNFESMQKEIYNIINNPYNKAQTAKEAEKIYSKSVMSSNYLKLYTLYSNTHLYQ